MRNAKAIQANTTVNPQEVENIYCSLTYSDGLVRPGAVKLAEKKWQPASVELVLIRGYVRGIKSATVLESKTYSTLKAANRVSVTHFRKN